MNNEILLQETILLDINVNNQEELFALIANKGIDLNRIKAKKVDKIVKAFLSREQEGSTGFEDGFAIPHAQSKYILEPTIFVVRLSNDIEWETFDEKPVKVAIALLVPESRRSSDHLAMLGSVSKKLMDETFRQQLKTATSAKQVQELLGSK